MKKIIVWVSVVVITTGFIARYNYKQGVVTDIKETDYRSVSEIQQSVGFNFKVPDILANDTESEYARYNGVVSIKSKDLDFVVSEFIGNREDVDLDSKEYSIDKEYNITGDTDIRYLRLRTESDSIESMSSCKVTYNNGEVAYSLNIDRECEYDEVIGLIGLKVEQTEEIKTVQKDLDITEGDSYDTYRFNYIGYDIQLPKLFNRVNIVSGFMGFKYIAIIIDGKSVMSIEDCNSYVDNADGTCHIQLSNGYTLKYYKENPFELSTTEYSSYDNILNSINYIAKSFKEIDK